MLTARNSGSASRARHRGVSHHSLTAYGRVALAPAEQAERALNYVNRAREREGAAALQPAEALSAAAANLLPPPDQTNRHLAQLETVFLEELGARAILVSAIHAARL